MSPSAWANPNLTASPFPDPLCLKSLHLRLEPEFMALSIASYVLSVE